MTTNYIPNGYTNFDAVSWGTDDLGKIMSCLPDGRFVFVHDSTGASPKELVEWDSNGKLKLYGPQISGFAYASLPAAGNAGRLAYVSSGGTVGLYLDNGSTWTMLLAATGVFTPAQGGTGIDTSASTGVPYLVAGTWAICGDVINVKHPTYGAVGDGVTDDTAAFQAAHDACGANGAILIPPGTYALNEWCISKSDLTILCYGVLAPLAAGDTCIIIGQDSSGDTQHVARLKGNLTLSTGQSWFQATVSDWRTTTALKVVDLYEADVHLDITGFGYAMKIVPELVGTSVTSAPVAYNVFHIGRLYDNMRAVYIDCTATGYCNENTWIGGRYGGRSLSFAENIAAGGAATDPWLVYIADNGVSYPNNNRWLNPSFEGAYAAFYCEASYNRVFGARWEPYTTGTAGVNFPEPYWKLGSLATNNHIQVTYNGNIWNTLQKDLGAGTRSDDRTFTMAGDFTAWLFRGAPVSVTVGGTVYETHVITATYSNPNTTVRVAAPIVTNNPTAVEVHSLQSEISVGGNSLEFVNAIPTSGRYEMQQGMYKAYISSHMSIMGVSSEYPALRLNMGSSAVDPAIEICNLTGRSAYIDHNGVFYSNSRLELTEVSAPGAAPADACRLYVDNGGAGGKSRLMAIFQSGPAQVVASEP